VGNFSDLIVKSFDTRNVLRKSEVVPVSIAARPAIPPSKRDTRSRVEPTESPYAQSSQVDFESHRFIELIPCGFLIYPIGIGTDLCIPFHRP
ncbi:hypothetical protein MPER_01785, partial [Moniliophthora perniciosa FA553]